jgi:RNA polymerase sigma-70 factor, ECF subfamily
VPVTIEDPSPAFLARVRAGDEGAFRALYERYAALVHGFLARMLRDPVGAEDALQETFLRVMRGVARFDPAGPARLSTWILGIARRVALTELERRAARAEPPGAVMERAEPPDHELRAALARALGALPAHQRSVFVLSQHLELSYEEIARVEEVDIGTVRSRLHRARAALQAMFESDQDQEKTVSHERRASR